MDITVAQRLQLFSHAPGSACLIPGTAWQVQAFPVRVVFTAPSGAQHVIALRLKGPAEGFTLMQDLERGQVSIFGRWQEGFFSWQIEVKDQALFLRLERTPEEGCVVMQDEQSHPLRRKEALLIAAVEESILTQPFSDERLSFGCHKKQEWEGIWKRRDMVEILPLWLRLGQLIPPATSSTNGQERGTAALLRRCFDLANSEKKEELPEALRHVFLGGFRSMLIPTLIDDSHQGLVEATANEVSSPLLLLCEGARLIRDLFFREEGGAYALLPALPSAWHCGRFIGIRTSSGDNLDLEWSKKQIRRVVWRPTAAREIALILPRAIKTFRVRTSLQNPGWRQDNGSLLSLAAGRPLYLDRFEK